MEIKLKNMQLNGTTPLQLDSARQMIVDASRIITMEEVIEPEVSKEQLREEYWPFLGPQPILSKLLITAPASKEWMENIEGIECRLPIESLLREARLLNIPGCGFCVSADIEKVTAESYRYLNDHEEFTPPVI